MMRVYWLDKKLEVVFEDMVINYLNGNRSDMYEKYNKLSKGKTVLFYRFLTVQHHSDTRDGILNYLDAVYNLIK